MQDYSKLLFEAQIMAYSVLQSSLTASLKAEVVVTHSAALFNETQTKHQIVADSSSTLVFVLFKDKSFRFISIFNPLPYSFVDTVSVRVNLTELQVISNGESVLAQIEPYIYKGDVAQHDYLVRLF